MESGYQLGNETVLALIIALELIFGMFYAWWVDWISQAGRGNGYGPFLVVGGTFFTVAIATPLIGILNTVIILSAFVITGLPMILWTTYRHTEERSRREQTARQLLTEFQAEAGDLTQILIMLRQLQQQLNEENDDGHEA